MVGECISVCVAETGGMGDGFSTSVISDIGVIRRVFHWCVRDVVCRTHVHVALLNGVNPVVTLGDGMVSTLNKAVPSTLCTRYCPPLVM